MIWHDMQDDLKTGHKEKPYLANLLTVVKRVKGSESDQVDELLKLATSSDILARSFVGWQPWI